MHEIARWDLDRLYPIEDILTPILGLKEQYYVTKDVVILSKLIQAIEKAEYYLYCRSAEESVASEIALLTVKVKELKSEVQHLIQQNEVETSNNSNNGLIKDELNAWESMYIQLRNRIEIEHNEKQLSFGQANNIAMNSDNEKERLEVFELLISALNVYKKRKASITWHELMTVKENNEAIIPFSVAVKNIYDALKNIDEELAQFAQNAIANGWVDAEPRDNKPPGGFCAPFFSEKESRISMRYDGTIDSVRVLAHELGHAWHFYVMSLEQSTSFLDDYLPMSTAESASIFFETVLINYLIQTTDSIDMKKSLLSWKIRNSFNYVMAIRASFEFEKNFYEKCKESSVSADEIEKLSIAAQEKAYGNALSEYQPFVWMKYVQFYIADIPFYNYPYTFGYLASFSLLEMAQETKSTFHSKYKEFLRETGKAPVEELMKKHFEIDITSYEFWDKAFKQISKDIDEYLQLT
ncbi:M3 family metallopeptidase [Bacillus cereus group sp. RP37]|uniref:M3 family metallopeptidase n=1 Tax=Bacillus cereus group sp. RP37 TaxID=3040259 RepID=UPI003390D8C0